MAIVFGCAKSSDAVKQPQMTPTGEVGTQSAKGSCVFGRLIYGGHAPEPGLIRVRKKIPGEPEDEGTIPDLSLVVDPSTRGIANVIVVASSRGGEEMHVTRVEPAAASRVVLHGYRLTPRVLIVEPGGRLAVVNEEEFGTNIAIMFSANSVSTFELGPGEHKHVLCKRAEAMPAPIISGIHPWIRGTVMVAHGDNATVSTASGEFVLWRRAADGVSLRFWHERTGWLSSKYLSRPLENGELDERGRISVRLTDLRTDLGDIVVSPDAFESNMSAEP